MPTIMTAKGRIEPPECEENEVFAWHPMLVGWDENPHDREPGYGAKPRWSEIEWSVTHKASGYKVGDFGSKEQAAGAAADLAEMEEFRMGKRQDIEAAAKGDSDFRNAVTKVLDSWNAVAWRGVW